MALVELSVVEQRYRAVLDAVAGVPVTEVADRYGVSRQSVHAWVRRYEQGGLAGLMDRSRRPESCPHQASAEVETAVCELRREHLDRYAAALMALDAAIDDGHAAAANLRFDEVVRRKERRHVAEKIVGQGGRSGTPSSKIIQLDDA